MPPTTADLERAVSDSLDRAEGLEVVTPAPELYLDLAESVVRQASAWQSPDGMMGDPHNAPGVESVTATARYTAALGHLIAAGRCEDLTDSAMRAMDYCCGELARNTAAGEQWICSSFNVKDMMILYETLEGIAPADRFERWTRALAEPSPELLHYPPDTRNFTFFGVSAETLRIKHGLSDRWDWVDDTLALQMPDWTDYGMYRDPGDPTTYDLTVRQALTLMLDAGYAGRHERWMRETLHSGALVSLLQASPTGVVSFGGRSAQYQMQEAMLAWLGEWQAREEAAAGDLRLAGALRRMALAGAEAVSRWLLREPYSCAKNLMSEHPFWGQDGFGEGHNANSGYGLLAANLFAGAHRVTDQSIAPGPAPSDIGGHALHLSDAFYRVWATAGDYHIQVDTRGQAGYDATGLCRLHRRGVPIETALNMGMPSAPKYIIPVPAAPQRVAFGVGWQSGDDWRYLSELTRDDDYEVTVDVVEEGDAVRVVVRYEGAPGLVGPTGRAIERYDLSPRGLRYEGEFPEARRVRLQVPIIETDGESRSEFHLTISGLEARYMGHMYRVRLDEPAVAAHVEDWSAPNRNGVYRVAVFDMRSNRAVCEATLT
jgi:hypothetical protein